MPNTNQSDHDLLIELAVGMKNILKEIQDIKMSQVSAQSAAEVRIRKLEDDLNRFDTTKTALSISSLEQRVDELEAGKVAITGGWKGISIVSGILVAIASFIINIITFVLKVS